MNLLEDRPRELRYLFLDLNSYFASVEQQEHPELRGKPVAVVPVMADSSFVIAASYEAKAFGVKTGTRIRDARRMCPGLELVKGNHTTYAAYHHRILEVVEQVLPVEEVCSIDEMRFRLLGAEREEPAALELAQKMKTLLWEQVGEAINCSIGIASNGFLAKLATELEKPNGLQVIHAADLPQRLLHLKLTDFTGINRKMMARLKAGGIFSVADLYAADSATLRAAFGSVIGERWWYLIRGYDFDQNPAQRRTLGHSHVLAPSLRNERGVKQVLLRLLHKAASRLRHEGLVTGEVVVHVKSFSRPWEVHLRIDPTQDTVRLTQIVMDAWKRHDFDQPRAVAITFLNLQSASDFTASLFAEEKSSEQVALSKAVDELNQKFGKNSVYLAGLHEAKDSAPERIAFNKTWLFQEGKGDNDWSKFRFGALESEEDELESEN